MTRRGEKDVTRSGILAVAVALLASAGSAQEIDFEIADDDLRRAVKAASLVQSVRKSEDPSAQDYVAAARADYRQILTALYAQGYFGGSVSIRVDGREAAAIDPLEAPARIERIEVRVDPGPQFTFGRTEIAPLAPGTLLPESFGPGQPASTGAITEAARAAVEGWRAEGHAKAGIADEEIIARHGPAELDVALTVAPGPQLGFGTLTVEGNERVREARIRAIAGFPTGETYDPEDIDRVEARLRRTGAFRSATLVEAETPAPDGTLPFTLEVLEERPRRIGVGLEFSSLDGATVSAFWLHRNLLGGAERFRIEGEVAGLGQTGGGGQDYTLDVSFTRPATFRPDQDFFATATLERVDDPGYRLDQVSLEAGLTRRITDRVTVSAGLGFLAAEVEDDLGARSYSFVTLPLGGEWDRRDDPLDATAGTYLAADLTPFVALDGDGAGGRLYVDGRAYRSFGPEDRVTLALRLQFGSVFGIEAADAPADYLFYSGGGGTVRGQPYQSLAIDAGGGNEIGGRSFAGAQVEARVGVTDRISVVGFYDVGLVGADPLPGSGDPSQAGAGLGLRYDTGLGPIRLDIATPVTGDDPGGSVEVYIGIGQAF